MISIKQIGKRTYYFTGPFHVGLYVIAEGDSKGMPVCLIDTGLNAACAEEIDRLLCERNFYVSMIINTHYHADHTGGNLYFQERYGCDILSTKLNAALISNYDICPAVICGAKPVDEVLTEYFYTESTQAMPIEDYTLPKGLEILDLAGHCIGMLGVKTSDNIVFVGDAVLGNDTLEYNSLSYIYDIGEHLKTLDRLECIDAGCFVPYHAEPVSDILELVMANRAAIMNIISIIKDICMEPKSFDEIYSIIYSRSGLKTTLYKYMIEGSIIREYLSYLHNNGELETVIIDNFLKWHTVDG